MKRTLLALCALAMTATFAPRTASAQDTLVGPNKADFLMGPSIGIVDASGTQFRLQFDYGYNVMPASWGNLYINLPLGLGFGNNLLALLLMPGVEADFRLPVSVPIYLYPKAGLSFGLFRFSGISRSEFAFGFYFGGGVKYVLDGKWNFLFEPINIEIYPLNGIPNATIGAYNLMFGVGMNF